MTSSHLKVDAVVFALITACPDCVKEKDTDGDTPLHVALGNKGIPEGIVRALLAAWPDGVKEADSSGNRYANTSSSHRLGWSLVTAPRSESLRVRAHAHALALAHPRTQMARNADVCARRMC